MDLRIGEYEIGTGRTFVIAEIGNNHNGDFERAKEMIDLAAEMGADCAKFQMRQIEQVYRERSLRRSGEDLGTEYIVDLLNRFELPIEDHFRLASYCASKGILYLCTPWDLESVKILEGFGVEAYKVSSADLTNLPLVEKLCLTGKPIILSTGMSTRLEVEHTVDLLNSHEATFALLHCNSTYPAPYHDIQLRWIENLRQMHPLVGYSGHERGIAVSLAAVALGACIIERHFTLDRTMEGPDHAASLEYDEFRSLIEGIRQIETAMGSNHERSLSQGEMINRENLSKSLVAACTVEAGTTIGPEHVKVRSPGQGLSPQKYGELLGRTSRRRLAAEDFFYESDLKDTRVEPRGYRFRRPWGVPVRYHDFETYVNRVDADFFEFHLSYSDMDVNLSEHLGGEYACGFVVHAPELFADSHLMDLAAIDEEYRQKSLYETQRVIDITRQLKTFFPRTPKPLIIANVGGFSMDEPIPESEKPRYYEQLSRSLEQLDTEGVELIPQTMAPFPWHFGGQRYQNLFVKIEEIVEWCQRLNLRMCFDISHSSLTCNYLKTDFYEFTQTVAEYTAHLHLGDAMGLNGEGLQIGDGDLDFPRIGRILDERCPEASFIPEIWQGHKDAGEGFWIALERLEGAL